MGQSSSTTSGGAGERRRNRYNSYPAPQRPQGLQPYYYPPPPPPPPPSSSAAYPSYPPNPPPPSDTFNAYNTLIRIVDSFMGRAPTVNAQTYLPPPPPPPPPYYPYYPQQGPHQGNAWWGPRPPSSSNSGPSSSGTMVVVPPQYVEHQKAKKVKNDVNVHKDSVALLLDDNYPDHHLVSFTFDAMVDGSFTIYYFAKEGSNGDLSPVYVDMYAPKRIPFQKGFGQKFCQPSGSGIDLGFFESDDLSKPLNGDVFPLAIYAEACPQPLPESEQVGQSAAVTCAQITQAVMHKTNDESFQVKVVKQILWANGERYELQELFGLTNSTDTEEKSNDDKADDGEEECVICLSEPKNTAVLPCRHMCMCSECAKALRLQSNKCPICRQPVERLMEINVNNTDR